MSVAVAPSRWKAYASFVKLEHTVFSLPLIYAGVMLGHAWPSASLVVLVLLAAIGGRVMAMGLNRLIDREIDRRNPRTQARELPRGVLHVWEGWLVVGIAGTLYVMSASAISQICLALSPIPLVLFVVYPYLKRFTSLAHLGLGLAWSMAPLGGWLAGETFGAGQDATLAGAEWGNLPLMFVANVGWLWLFSVLWVTGFDIIYATMDETFDRQVGLHSLPAALGSQRALHIAAAIHALAFLTLVALWWTQLRSWVALIWLLSIGAHFIWQHAIATRKPEFAFFQLNALIGFLVFGFVLAGM